MIIVFMYLVCQYFYKITVLIFFCKKILKIAVQSPNNHCGSLKNKKNIFNTTTFIYKLHGGAENLLFKNAIKPMVWLIQGGL